MLDRLNALTEVVKKMVLYILTPLAFIVGFFYMLLSKNKELVTKIEDQKLKDELGKSLEKGVTDEAKAHDVELAYQRARDEYLRGNSKD